MADAKCKSLPSLRRLVGDLAAIPSVLQNANTEVRLSTARHALVNAKHIHEAAGGIRRTPRAPAKHVHIVSGGLPTLGKSR